ncbi:unnamed protein product [Fraxinus pennsylvanica]|uniref:Uncharacterized protein n=1 Tax=Fraxinus pennsylvanica TaxID=56036 RepID=A0AAD2E3N7_9LAMI|nr:unnamed protein product [Fraxinus pennsylvanica]
MLIGKDLRNISGWSTPIRDDQNIQVGSSSSSTVNDTDWERLLPPDYEDIISRSVNPVAYATKEDLYTSLVAHLFYLMEAKWKLTPHVGSRFSMVAELRDIWALDIQGKIETQMLSPNTRYAAFLVYRLEKDFEGPSTSSRDYQVC